MGSNAGGVLIGVPAMGSNAGGVIIGVPAMGSNAGGVIIGVPAMGSNAGGVIIGVPAMGSNAGGVIIGVPAMGSNAGGVIIGVPAMGDNAGGVETIRESCRGLRQSNIGVPRELQVSTRSQNAAESTRESLGPRLTRPFIVRVSQLRDGREADATPPPQAGSARVENWRSRRGGRPWD
ncbi:uncharacterized protein LOC127001833 [Eriocheir sinensis]|uniref:uncharacterized protein LOC127001833 n=1 Tax=Eriocheir sinensis TaxID=95602 RepID=UPI0021CA5C79|nr:uncharacterized protein LOC127001833 [Eriocheir sinensis]